MIFKSVAVKHTFKNIVIVKIIGWALICIDFRFFFLNFSLTKFTGIKIPVNTKVKTFISSYIEFWLITLLDQVKKVY